MVDLAELNEQFRSTFGRTPKVAVRAPGRVNLIGEHTDYNEGFVLPAALDLATYVAAAPRRDRTIRVHSSIADSPVAFDLDDAAPKPRRDWSDYVRGVCTVLERPGRHLSGADLLIASDLPPGAGLSSSAALEVAAAYALLAIGEIRMDLNELALACQSAENEFVGARCGIMDQLVACHGEENCCLLIDCRNLDRQSVPLDPRFRLVICNTTVRHRIAAGEYNVRRQECEEGVRRLAKALPGIVALRDVTPEELDRHADMLTPLLYRRCRHVVTENERTLRAADALRAGNLDLIGDLMRESQASMRDDFETSCPEIDIMVGLNEAAGGAIGARMTGGGFGGSTISLVAFDAVDAFREEVAAGYRAATGLEAQIFACSAGPGVRAIG